MHGIKIETLVFIGTSIGTHDGDVVRDEEVCEHHSTEIKDFLELYHAVAEVGNWEGLCYNLEVNEARMSELRNSNELVDAKKRECLKAYFDSGEAYWENVVKALVRYPVGNRKVANEIVEKYKLREELSGHCFV